MSRDQTFAWRLALLSLVLWNSTGCSSVPDECDQNAPLEEQPACLQALHARCAGLATREECAEQDPISFHAGVLEYEAYCGWVDVVEFRDPGSCGHPSAHGTCAGLASGNSEIACESGCEGAPPVLPDRFGAISESELIYFPCAPGGGPAYTLGIAVENGGCDVADEGSGSSAPICQCIPDACAALGQ